jgi:hypothetical protein
MPIIVWYAIVLAILLIGGSTALNLPTIIESTTKVAASAGTSLLVPIAYGIAIVMVLVSVAYSIMIAKGKNNK